MGELAGTTLNNPVEVVRQNMQLLTYKRPRDAIKDIWKKRGVPGFFAGYFATLFRNAPFSIITMPLYEYFQHECKKIGGFVDKYKVFISGSLSSIIAGIITNPFDVIKTRMMTNTVGKHELTMTQWLKKTIEIEGLRGLLRGCHYRTLGMAIGGALYYGSYASAFTLMGADDLYNRYRK